MKVKWEYMEDVDSDHRVTSRLKVPGGWLYRCTWYEDDKPMGAMTFVPAPEKAVAK